MFKSDVSSVDNSMAESTDPEISFSPSEEFAGGSDISKSVNRRLGTYEDLVEEGQRLHGFMINVDYLLVRSKTELTTDQIKAALKKLQRRITALRLVCTGAGENKFFKECGKLDLHFEVLSTYDWKAVYEEQQKIKFAEANPLWRVKLLRPEPAMPTDANYYPFLFAYDHAIVDGCGIMYGINKYFIDYLEEAVTGGLDAPIDSLPFPRPPELVLPEARTTGCGPFGWSCLFFCCRCCVSQMSKKTSSLVDKLFRKYRPTRPVSANGLADFVLSAEETLDVIQACKRNGIKVNGFITAAVAVATYKLLEDYEIIEGGKVTFDSGFMVNVRRFANPRIPDEHVGLWSGYSDHKIKVKYEATDVASQPFWDLAKKCHSDIHNMVNRGRHFMFGRMRDSLYMKYGPQWIFNADSLKKKAFFTITNRGSFLVKAKNRENPNISLEKTHWGCADFMVGNNALFTHSLCTLNGRLQWSVSYSKLIVTKTFAREYVDMIKRTIVHASSCCA